MKQLFFIGNYSDKGIDLLEFDDESINLKKLLKFGNMKNNSYLCRYKDYLYSVIEISGDEEVDSGYVASFDVRKPDIKLINQEVSYGKGPCFLTVDQSREILYVANYEEGSFSAFKLEADGRIGKKLLNKKYGEISRVHNIQFSNDCTKMYLIDLGLNVIIEYSINYEKECLELIELSKIHFNQNTNPRHIVIDEKDNIYIITEKSCELYKLGHNDKNQLMILDKKSILPENEKKQEEDTGAAIKIDSNNQYIYVSIRGKNRISVFNSQNLKLIQNIKCEGNCPRDITLDKYEKYLLCANQLSDSITIFEIQNGKLVFQKEYHIESPSCIVVD